MDRPDSTVNPVPGSFGGPRPLEFELLAEIATGPTARVELCRITAPADLVGQLVAVKRLHPHIAEDPQFATMFVDEVWMTAALQSPNVIRVAGWGTDRDGTYLAVELVQGVSLARLMKTVFETREIFTERMVVYLGSEICAGLAAAHALRSPTGEPLGLVHRDLTPGNVLLGFDGQVKIADFGLAKAKQRVTKTLTGLLKGHPQYMAPEQARDGPIDSRADLFSLGVVLFELFSGRHPWSAGTELEVFHLMAQQPPIDLASLRPKLDRELAAIVSRLLEQDPDRRFQSADEVRVRLLAWLDAHGYKTDNDGSVARFVRRNAMRQMRWFERAIGGELRAEAERAKARLGIANRARQCQAGPPPGVGTRSDHARPAAVSSRRRRRNEEPPELNPRLASTVPDGADLDDPQNAEWSEEIPTVVKPNERAGKTSTHSAPLPDPLAEEDSDQKTTAVKAKSPAAALLLKKLPPPRLVPPAIASVASVAAPQTDSGPTRPMSAPPSQDTLLDMAVPPMLDAGTGGEIADPESEEVPTHPLRSPPVLAALHKLPPPRPEGAAPETQGDFTADVERMSTDAARLRSDAERTAKLAAHKAVLAQIAAEAAQLAREAAQALSADRAHASSLIAEARRLEQTVRRGEASPPVETSGVDVPRGSRPPEAVSALTPQPAPFALGAGVAHPARSSAPPPEPLSPAPQSPMLGAAVHEAPGPRLVGRGAAAPRFAPQPRTIGGELKLLLSGEVWGLPVPVALGAAFALALALVVVAAVLIG